MRQFGVNTPLLFSVAVAMKLQTPSFTSQASPRPPLFCHQLSSYKSRLFCQHDALSSTLPLPHSLSDKYIRGENLPAPVLKPPPGNLVDPLQRRSQTAAADGCRILCQCKTVHTNNTRFRSCIVARRLLETTWYNKAVCTLQASRNHQQVHW